MKQLVINIHQLVNVRSNNQLLRGPALADLPCLEKAYLEIEAGIIVGYGLMQELILSEADSYEKELGSSEKGSVSHKGESVSLIDAAGATVLPSWCDSHTHLVFAASRESEFVDKIKGLSYAEIAAKGGGILNSAHKLNLCTEDELFNLAWARLQEWMKLGTGGMEIKSGYGLSVAGELKMLRVIKRLKLVSPIPIKASFLAAHTYPIAYKEDHEGYISLIINEMLPIIEQEGLADFIDVFCEEGFFSVEETIRICAAGAAIGLRAKIHANQLHLSGGVEAGIQLKALSVDHLETMDDSSIAALAASNTIGTLLPTAAYFLRMHFQPARALIKAGAAIALASDFNPGSSPSANMNTVVSMACIQLKMLPEEAINAATINGAFAMELENELGSISIGKRANLIFTKPIPSIAYLPYAFGSNLIERVMVSGKFL